jgi:hypothetical protein
MKKISLLFAVVCFATFPSFAAVHALSRTAKHAAHLSPIRAAKDLAFVAKKSTFLARHPKKTARGIFKAGTEVF